MSAFPQLTTSEREALLALPSGPANMVLDTDTANEIDDQFALVYSLLSPNLNVEAVYAAPYFNSRSTGPANGMEKSYEEILRVLDRLGYAFDDDFVYKGSSCYLPSKSEPVASSAAEDLIAKAMAPRDEPLYVLTIGCITNIASALLIEPEIIKKIVIVWLGGQPYYWSTAREFNLQQDVPAAQVVFDSGAAVVQIPCKNVAEHLRTTVPEMRAYVQGQGAIGDYLCEIFEGYTDDHYAWSKVIWDISSVAYMNNPGWVPTALCPSPILKDDVTWGAEEIERHTIRVATDVNRDAVFGDLFRKLAQHAAQ